MNVDFMEKHLKEYNLYVMRAHFQVRAKQKMLGNELYMQKEKKDLQLYKNVHCAKKEEPEVKDVEKYQIVLNVQNPNLLDLYTKIREICPEFSSKRSFHLYWKCSAEEILPISNHITYMSMMSLISNVNNNLYLIAREWNDIWLNDTAATYVALPEDRLLVNMVAPRQSVFTVVQEEKFRLLKAAAMTETSCTYLPPERPSQKTSVKGKEKRPSPKPKSPKKK